MEAAVVDGFEEESQQVGEGQGEEQGQPVGLGLDRVPVAPPGCQQDPSIDGDEGVVDDAPASGATLGHVEPAKVPNEADGGPVEPLPAGAVHEVCPLSPGPQCEDTPERQEVSGEVDAEDRGKESKGHHARRNKQEVPQEVDQRGSPALLGLVWEEGAQGAVVVHHHPGDRGDRRRNAHDCKKRRS